MRHGGGAVDGVLEDEIPPDDPRRQLAERRVRAAYRPSPRSAPSPRTPRNRAPRTRRPSPRPRRTASARGPALSCAAWPVSTKMPVPMMAPIPRLVRCSGPRARRRRCSPLQLLFHERYRLADEQAAPHGLRCAGLCGPARSTSSRRHVEPEAARGASGQAEPAAPSAPSRVSRTIARQHDLETGAAVAHDSGATRCPASASSRRGRAATRRTAPGWPAHRVGFCIP